MCLTVRLLREVRAAAPVAQRAQSELRASSTRRCQSGSARESPRSGGSVEDSEGGRTASVTARAVLRCGRDVGRERARRQGGRRPADGRRPHHSA